MPFENSLYRDSCSLLSFHLTGLFSSYCRSGSVFWKRTFGDNWSKLFTCWSLFLSPNQQCQSTQCRDV